jgi:Zn-dependent protease with chaperone function
MALAGASMLAGDCRCLIAGGVIADEKRAISLRWMQLAILTAVLAAIAAGEGGGGPVVGLAWRLVVVAIAMSVAPLAALVSARTLAVSDAHPDDAEDRASRLETLIIALWLSAVALILVVAQWPRIVRANWQLAGLPLVDEVAILTPVIGPLLLIWAAMHRRPCSWRRLCADLWQQARQQLALLLLPPLAVVGVLESLTWFNLVPAKIDTAWWFALPLVGMTLVLMPLAVRRLWHTSPLIEPALRSRLDAMCLSRRSHVREILIWHTGYTMANAAVVGLSRWLRYLLLSDVLLSRLSDDEIAAVVRHELAHLRRWHLPLRLAALLLPVALWFAVQRAAPETALVLTNSLKWLTGGSSAIAAVALPLVFLAYAVAVVGWYSRLLEHDADLDASLDDSGRVDARLATDFCTALITLCGRGHESWLGQWLHPSVQRRVDFVRNVIADPGFMAGFRRRLLIIAVAIVVLYFAAASAALLA